MPCRFLNRTRSCGLAGRRRRQLEVEDGRDRSCRSPRRTGRYAACGCGGGGAARGHLYQGRGGRAAPSGPPRSLGLFRRGAFTSSCLLRSVIRQVPLAPTAAAAYSGPQRPAAGRLSLICSFHMYILVSGTPLPGRRPSYDRPTRAVARTASSCRRRINHASKLPLRAPRKRTHIRDTVLFQSCCDNQRQCTAVEYRAVQRERHAGAARAPVQTPRHRKWRTIDAP